VVPRTIVGMEPASVAPVSFDLEFGRACEAGRRHPHEDCAAHAVGAGGAPGGVPHLGAALTGREPGAARPLHAGPPSYMTPEQWPGYGPGEAQAAFSTCAWRV